MRPTVAIVDYGMGNLDSIARAVEECGGRPRRSERPEQIADADHIILPGVGAFARGMASLRESGFAEALGERVLGQGVPCLGICLGMQLLADTGAEGGETPGLGWIRGRITRFRPTDAAERVPHMGWNEVRAARANGLIDGIRDCVDFYFVHSYYLSEANGHDVVATTPYCCGFPSIVASGPVFGVQFHPEKSQAWGFRLLTNFLAQ